MVRGTYQITDLATGQVVTSVVAEPVPTGETSKVVVPAGKLLNGKTYSFRTTTDADPASPPGRHPWNDRRRTRA
ncbi:hypothetical protein [Streptomyces sp. NPDC055709]